MKSILYPLSLREEGPTDYILDDLEFCFPKIHGSDGTN